MLHIFLASESQLGQGITVLCHMCLFLEEGGFPEREMDVQKEIRPSRRFEVGVLLSFDIGLGPLVASSTLEFRADSRTTELMVYQSHVMT